MKTQPNTKVEIYRNLHKDCFSIRRRGRVVGHLQDCHYLRLNNVKFVVQPAGHKRVLREKKKNVHAFVRGEAVFEGMPDRWTEGWGESEWHIAPFHTEVTYNPYKGNTFYYTHSGFPITEADEVLITRGIVWVK